MVVICKEERYLDLHTSNLQTYLHSPSSQLLYSCDKMFFKAIMPFLAVVFALPVAPAGEGETRTPEVGTDGALSPVTWPGKREFEVSKAE